MYLEEPSNFLFISSKIKSLCEHTGLQIKESLGLESELREFFRTCLKSYKKKNKCSEVTLDTCDLVEFCDHFNYRFDKDFMPYIFKAKSNKRIANASLTKDQYRFYITKMKTAVCTKFVKGYVKMPHQRINTFKQWQIYDWLCKGQSREAIHRRTRMKKNRIDAYIAHLLKIYDYDDELEFFKGFDQFKDGFVLDEIERVLDSMDVSHCNREVILKSFELYDRPAHEIREACGGITRANHSLIYRKLYETLNLPLEIKNKRRAFYYIMYAIIKDRSL